MDISGTYPMLYAFFDEAGALRLAANDVLVIPHAGQMHNYHTMSSYAGPISEYFPFRLKSATSSSATFSTASRSPRTALSI